MPNEAPARDRQRDDPAVSRAPMAGEHSSGPVNTPWGQHLHTLIDPESVATELVATELVALIDRLGLKFVRGLDPSGAKSRRVASRSRARKCVTSDSSTPSTMSAGSLHHSCAEPVTTNVLSSA